MIRAIFAALFALLVCGPARADEPSDLRRDATAHYELEWSPGLDGFARHLMAGIEDEHARIYGALGADPDVTTRVTLVGDAEAMLALAREREGGRPPEWAAGLAYPSRRHIYLHAAVGRDELETTLQHEIVHVALGVATDDARVPRWFHEGVAIRLSEGPALERIRLLTEAALMDGLIDLDRLDQGFPASGARAGIAYAQAVHFVGFLQSKYGEARFHALIAALRGGDTTFAAAVESIYPEPLAAIERAWRSDLRLWWGWIPVIFGTTTLWVAGGLLLVAAWRRRRGQYRQRLARLEAEESADALPEVQVAPPAHRPPPPRFHDPYDGRPPTIH